MVTMVKSERIHEILYSTASREELAERIAELENLALLEHETIRDLQESFNVCVVSGDVALTAEYFEREYLAELDLVVRR